MDNDGKAEAAEAAEESEAEAAEESEVPWWFKIFLH